jgi:hypothetical protein
MQLPVIRIVFFFRWFDLWIGAYIDTKNRRVYICPVPMLGFYVQILRWEKV